jgi:hypothetical protein
VAEIAAVVGGDCERCVLLQTLNALLWLLHACRWSAYVRWAVWLLLGTLVYLFYSMHHTQVSRPPAGVQ